MSQNDTIELRGFDENDKNISKKARSAAHKKRSIERAIANKTKKQQNQGQKDDDGGSHKNNDGRSSHTPQDGDRHQEASLINEDVGGGGDGPKDTKVEHKITQEQSIDFDDILKCDSLSGFITVSLHLK